LILIQKRDPESLCFKNSVVQILADIKQNLSEAVIAA